MNMAELLPSEAYPLFLTNCLSAEATSSNIRIITIDGKSLRILLMTATSTVDIMP